MVFTHALGNVHCTRLEQELLEFPGTDMMYRLTFFQPVLFGIIMTR